MALTTPCDFQIVIANRPLGMMESPMIIALNLSMQINMQKTETRVLTLLPPLRMDCLLPLVILALNLRLIRQTPPLMLPPTPPAPIPPQRPRPILVSVLHLAHSILFCSVSLNSCHRRNSTCPRSCYFPKSKSSTQCATPKRNYKS
jgi:hypothetical protein